MRKIREKLCSESGASILLALLFFLLCAMVGASVLMAAASNAGKSRSNREEQQKYLTLSSALQLVCDELTAAEYTAKYTVLTEIIDVYGVDKDDKPTVIGSRYKHTYNPASGEINGWSFSKTPCVLPIVEELDKVFANIGSRGKVNISKNEVDSRSYFYWTSPNEGAQQKVLPHAITIEVTPDDNTWLTEAVEVTAELYGNDSYNITLTAKLVEDNTYTMFATLVLDGDGPQLKESSNTTNGTVTESCDAIGWKLSQITREEPK